MDDKQTDISRLAVTLLKGVLHREKDEILWQKMMNLQGALRDYLEILGLDLNIYEDEGFAFLRNRDDNDDIPKLISRRPLSFPVSLMLAQLRRRLAEHDSFESEERLIMDRQEILDQIQVFIPPGNNEVNWIRKMDANLKKIQQLGFISFLGKNSEKVEVHRILGVFVDAQWLQDFERKMDEYIEYAGNNKVKEESNE